MPDKQKFQQMAAQIARQEGVPVALFLAQIEAESGWNPNSVSSAGAMGLGQLMPGTAQGLGVTDPFDPQQNLQGAAQYMASMLKRFGTPELALSAYNSGPAGAESSGQIEGFSETQGYVKKVMTLMGAYKKFDTGGNVGSLPLTAGKGDGKLSLTSYLSPPSDLGVRANLGPLSSRAVRDIQARAARGPSLVAQKFSKKQLMNNPVYQATNGKVPTYIDYGAPLGGKWSSGGGVQAHVDRAVGNWQSDNAVDLMIAVGTPVYAMADGKIGDRFGPLNSSDPRMAGLRLNLHAKNNNFYYAHLSAFAPGIKPGIRVKKGQLLGFSGEANGAAHLHLAMEFGSPDYLLSWWSNRSSNPRRRRKRAGK